MPASEGVAMSLVNGLRRLACGIVACAWVLTSCGGSGDAVHPAYAYVANEDTLSTYAINSSTGGLTGSVGSPLVLPTSWPFGGISQIATDPSGQFLYLLDYSGIYAYAIDRKTGALTAVAGSPFEGRSIPTSLAFDASGTYLYIAGYNGVTADATGVISAYSVNSSGGLAPLATYTVPSDLNTVAVAGNYLYVAGFYANSITVLSIGSLGELSQNVPGSPFATDTGPVSIAVNPSGSVLYTANEGMPTATEATPGSISAFTVDSSTGALAPVPGNPQPIAVQGALSIDPMGKFLFVPETGGVSVYTINANTGALAMVSGSPFPTGTAPSVVSIDPADRFVYVTNNGSANLFEFTLGSTGTLTPLTGSPVPVATDPFSIAIVW
jgi:6-phosphogluconolactonase (cycloisomerase 2 family)